MHDSAEDTKDHMSGWKMVRVEWIDSESLSGGWTPKDDFNDFAGDDITPCVSVGMLHTLSASADGHVVLVLSEYRHMVDGHIKIPKAAIKSITELVPKSE